jgi:diguanylate cyclase (GGDEF)-like protein/PAS domain S-box-containing protein
VTSEVSQAGATNDGLGEHSPPLLHSLLDHSSELLGVLDSEGVIAYVTPGVTRLLGYDPGAMLGHSAFDYVEPDHLSAAVEPFGRLLAMPPGGHVTATIPCRHADGSVVWLDLTGTNLMDNPAVAGIVLNARDVTEERRVHAALQESEERLAALVDHTDMIAVTDADGAVTYASPSVHTLMGYVPDRLMGEVGFDFIHPDDLVMVLAAFADVVAVPGVHPPLEVRARHADGSWRWFELTQTNLLNAVVAGVVHHFRDITVWKEAQAQLTHQALHDPLTGLPNRALITDRLEVSLGRTGRSGRHTAVFFLDLDHFKKINDRLGHTAGDQLLVAVAERLREVVRPEDTVARHGGDEFVLVCSDLADAGTAAAVADRITSAFEKPFRIDDGEVYISTSIGIAISETGDESAEGLVRDADAAVYKAKELGGACAAQFDPSLHTQAHDRLEIASALHRSLERGELLLHYQPIVELLSGRVIKMEALLRWQHPERGLMTPSDFLDIAEDTGQIIPMGIRVLELACEQVQHWRDADPHGGPISVAVNLSPRQLAQPDFASHVAAALRDNGVDASLVEFEITESALVSGGTLDTLRALRGLGVGLAIDDFGTGFSSLTQLRNCNVDVLKIDQNFVRGMLDQPEDHGIVAGVIGLAHGLGLSVTGEGVEHAAQLDALRELGCDHAQGFFVGRPGPPLPV